jgi:hypothetical protein
MSELIAQNDKEGRLAMRSSIESLEKALKDIEGSDRGDMDEVNANGLTEYLIGGAYTRVLKIPKGHTIISKLWRKRRLWIIVSGKVRITSEAGNQVVQAPYICEAPFGSKIALYAETEVLWAAITGLPETEDIADAEKYIVAEDYSVLTYPWDLLETEQ